MEMIRNYVIGFVVFFFIDIFWLGFVAKNVYGKYLGHLMADKTNWVAAIIFYTVFIGGLLFFAINPSVEKNSIMYAFLAGGLYGFITYFTYDMTNLATLKDWPVFISAIDIAWGTILNSLTAGVTFYVISFLAR